MTNDTRAANFAGRRSFDVLSVLRSALAVAMALVVSLTTVAPAFALSSSVAAPALAGLPASPAPVAESSGDGAATAAVPGNRGGTSGSMMLRSSVPTDGATAKFVPPEAPYNGAFTRSFPLDVPPFFELTPGVALNYNSGNLALKADDGFSPLGVGWRLAGGSSIERVSKFGGVPAFTADDVFALDDNALLDCATVGATPSCGAGGTHTTRYEFYQRVTKITSGGQTHWTVTARDGTISTYRPLGYWNPGGIQDARLRDSYRWLLQSVSDTDGNTVTYSYDCAALPTCYVSAIAYGTATLEFHWEARPDSFSHATGISIASVSQRLKSIVVKTGSTLIRAYKISYSLSPDTKKSLVSSLQQFGSDATIASGTISGGTALPAETFTYWDMASRRQGTMISDLVTANASPEGTASTTALELQSKLATATAPNANYVFGDFNGDNKTDLLVTKQGTGSCQATYYASGQWAGTSTTPTGGVTVSSSIAPIGFCTDASNWYIGDFNGDGRDDLATATTLAALTATARAPWTALGYAGTDAAIAVSLMNGSTVTGSIVVPAGNPGSGAAAGLRVAEQKAKLIIGDFNGDGRDDVFRGNVFLSGTSGFTRQTWAGAVWATSTPMVLPTSSFSMARTEQPQSC